MQYDKPECCNGEGGGHNGTEDPKYNMHTSHMLHTWNGEVQCRGDIDMLLWYCDLNSLDSFLFLF